MSKAYVVVDHDHHRDDFIWVFGREAAAIEFARARYEYYLREWEVSQADINELNREYCEGLPKRNDPETGKHIEPEPYYGFIIFANQRPDSYLGFESTWLVRATWAEGDFGIDVREVPYEA